MVFFLFLTVCKAGTGFYISYKKITTQAAQSKKNNPGFLIACTCNPITSNRNSFFIIVLCHSVFVLVHDMRTWYTRTVVSLVWLADPKDRWSKVYGYTIRTLWYMKLRQW